MADIRLAVEVSPQIPVVTISIIKTPIMVFQFNSLYLLFTEALDTRYMVFDRLLVSLPL